MLQRLELLKVVVGRGRKMGGGILLEISIGGTLNCLYQVVKRTNEPRAFCPILVL
jgi:hypothetical protein